MDLRRTFVTSCLLLFAAVASAQNIEIQRGDIHYEFFQFKEAIENYEAALKQSRNSKMEPYLLDRLAQCYKYSFQYKKAEEYFSRLVRLGDGKAEPDAYLDYGAILKINGDYARAKDQFQYYLTFFPDDPYASFQLRSLAWAVKHIDSVRNFTVTPTNLNISGQSLGYCLFDDGMIYATSRNKSGDNTNVTQLFDLDYAQMKDSITFAEGDRIMDEIQFELNEGSPSVSDDGLLVYFSANATKIKNGVVKKKVGAIEISSDGVANIKIYVAKLVNGKFVSPQELPFNNKEYNCMHPWVTDNGNTLYFASDMPKGFGGLDIYKVTRGQDGKWGVPQNLGEKINTAENEMYPFVSNGNFFYASKGLNGFGGYDLYQSKLTLGLPGVPVNMGQPFNSSHDDIAFICKADGRTGYFSSNRDNGEGIDKVYFFRDNTLFTATKKPVFAMLDSNEKPKTAVSKTQPKAPVTMASAEPVKKPGPVKKPAAQKPQKPAPATAAPDDELLKLVFEKVRFRFNEIAVPEASYVTLDSAITISRNNRAVKIQVNAHTDSRGSVAYNQKLSDQRAQAVKKYLLRNGVAASRIVTRGFGESQLLNNCTDDVPCSDDQHAENRRVEIRIVK